MTEVLGGSQPPEVTGDLLILLCGSFQGHLASGVNLPVLRTVCWSWFSGSASSCRSNRKKLRPSANLNMSLPCTHNPPGLHGDPRVCVGALECQSQGGGCGAAALGGWFPWQQPTAEMLLQIWSRPEILRGGAASPRRGPGGPGGAHMMLVVWLQRLLLFSTTATAAAQLYAATGRRLLLLLLLQRAVPTYRPCWLGFCCLMLHRRLLWCNYLSGAERSSGSRLANGHTDTCSSSSVEGLAGLWG